MGKHKNEKQIEVLLIEDDPMVREVNRMFIEKVDGFVVKGVASSGDEGKQKIVELNPNLVLLDVFMPEMNGLELIQQLRQEQLDVDVIAITAANDTKTVKSFLHHGVIDYIVKPFTFERLEKALKQYKEVHWQLRQVEQFSQEKLDELFSSNTLKEQLDLPKGLHEQTLNQIFEYLQGMESAKSAEEIGAEVGLARVTVRRYLNYLETIGKVKMELTYGTIGRPIQMYRMK